MDCTRSSLLVLAPGDVCTGRLRQLYHVAADSPGRTDDQHRLPPGRYREPREAPDNMTGTPRDGPAEASRVTHRFLRCDTGSEIEFLDAPVHERDVLDHLDVVDGPRTHRHDLQLARRGRHEGPLLRVLYATEPFRAAKAVNLARRVLQDHVLRRDGRRGVGVARRGQ